jgi:HTH DNA binding domain
MVFEMSFEGIWRLMFGSHADQVRVVEPLKCLKCDQDGFAMVCKVKVLDGSLDIEDLVKGSKIEHVEKLYDGKDGSVVIFLSGGSLLGPAHRRPPSTAILCEKPPEFVGVNRMKVSLVGQDAELQKFLDYAEEQKMFPRVLRLGSLKPQSDTIFSDLSPKQRQSVLTAYSMGYYDIPRRISSTDLAKLLKVDKSTLAEHLRKAERRILTATLAG